MLHGASGSGKTLLGMSFLVEGARQGQRGLYFGFFETPAELVAKTEGIGLPTSDLVASQQIDIVWRPPFDLLADKLAYEILSIARERKAERVFIDGMRGLHQSLIEPERARVFLAALTNELRARGIVAIVSEEKRELADDDLPEHGLASSLDNIVFLQHVKEGDSPPQDHLGREDAQRSAAPVRARVLHRGQRLQHGHARHCRNPHPGAGPAQTKPERLVPLLPRVARGAPYQGRSRER